MMDNQTATMGLMPDTQLPAQHAPLITAPFVFIKNNPLFLFALFISLYAAQLSYNIFFHPLSKVPGPFLARLNYLWLTINRWGGQWHETSAHLHKKYGPIVRIAPNELSFADKEGLRSIYGFGTATPRSKWYQTWQLPYLTTNWFATGDLRLHGQLRGRVAPTYTMSAVLQMEPFIQDLMDKLWVKMRDYAREGQPFDISQWLYFFTYDAISELALGRALGFLDKGEDVFHLIDSIGSGFKLQSSSGYMPGQMLWFENPLMRWYLRTFGDESIRGTTHFSQFVSDRYDERARDGLGERRRDMLQHFFEMKSISGQPVAKEEVVTEGILVLGAGGDTTGGSIASILARLLTNPEIVPKLQAEVDAAYKRLGLQKDEGISYTEASKLPFLSAVIKESMRLFPVAQSELPRMAPNEGITIHGHFIPKGTSLGVNPRVMNRSREVFGPTADEFRPERWIPTNATEEAEAKEASSLLTTFGFGTTGCVGKNIATMEIYKFIAQFIRQFELQSASSDKLWFTENYFAIRVKDFLCTIKERTV